MRTIGNIPMYIIVNVYNTDNNRGIWVSLPATAKRFDKVLAKIGADRGNVAIDEYVSKVPGLSPKILMRSPLSAVNYLAARIKRMQDWEITQLCAAIDAGYVGWGKWPVEEIIEYTFRADKYRLLTNVHNLADVKKRGIDPNRGLMMPQGFIIPADGWNETAMPRPIPKSLNIKGSINEDLYGDWENENII